MDQDNPFVAFLDKSEKGCEKNRSTEEKNQEDETKGENNKERKSGKDHTTKNEQNDQTVQNGKMKKMEKMENIFNTLHAIFAGVYDPVPDIPLADDPMNLLDPVDAIEKSLVGMLKLKKEFGDIEVLLSRTGEEGEDDEKVQALRVAVAKVDTACDNFFDLMIDARKTGQQVDFLPPACVSDTIFWSVLDRIVKMSYSYEPATPDRLHLIKRVLLAKNNSL